MIDNAITENEKLAVDKGLQKKSNHQIKLVVISDLISGLGSGAWSFAMGLMLLKLTGSALGFGMTQIIGPIVSLFLFPFVGKIVDTYNHKKILIIGQIASITAVAAFMLLFNASKPMWTLGITIAMITILKVADQFVFVAYGASVPHVVLSNDIQKMRGYQQSVQTVGGVLSPIVGAAIYGLVDFRVFAGIEIATEIAVLIFILAINFYLVGGAYKPMKERLAAKNLSASEPPKSVATDDTNVSMMAAIKWIFRQPAVVFVMIFSFFINFIFAGFNVGVGVTMMNVLHASSFQYSLSEAILFIGMLASSLIIARMKDFKSPIVVSVVAVLIMSGALMIYGIGAIDGLNKTLAIGLFYIASTIVGMLLSFANTPIGVWFAKNMPSHMMGRLNSIFMVSASCLTPLGVVLYSLMFDAHFSAVAIFVASGAAGLAFLVGLTAITVFKFKVDIKNLKLVE
ncbi:MAG: MFS transporter [Lactobacillales bacterium]|jgi:MFS family permease|nr:MFS transporter [Lactobacillales bacterium]